MKKLMKPLVFLLAIGSTTGIYAQQTKSGKELKSKVPVRSVQAVAVQKSNGKSPKNDVKKHVPRAVNGHLRSEFQKPVQRERYKVVDVKK